MKLGGDNNRGTFKMNFQILNVPAPNSVTIPALMYWILLGAN